MSGRSEPVDFRFAHASDLHIASRSHQLGFVEAANWLRSRGARATMRLASGMLARTESSEWASLSCVSSEDPNLVAGLVRFVRLHRSVLDAIVLSGDIATTGSRADLAHARRQLIVARRFCSNAVEGAAGPAIVVVPGNHDRFGDAPLFLPGGKRFNAAFRELWRVGRKRVSMQLVRRGAVSVALIGVDLTLRSARDVRGTPLGVWGQGRVYRDDCTLLRSCVAAARSEHQASCVVVVVHFPPECPVAREMQLLAEGDFARALGECGVNLVLAGHVHQPMCYSCSSGVMVMAAGSATQYHSPHGNYVHIVKLAVGETVVATTENYRWSDEAMDFVLE